MTELELKTRTKAFALRVIFGVAHIDSKLGVPKARPYVQLGRGVACLRQKLASRLVGFVKTVRDRKNPNAAI